MSVLIQDRDFAGIAGAVTTGVLRGENMRTWWNSFPTVTLIDLPDTRPGSHMRHFFTSLPIDDVPTDAMGCLQVSTFPRRAAPGSPPQSLAAWVGDNFLRKCRWNNSDGSRGGFLYRPALLLDKGGKAALHRVDEDFEVKLSDIGNRYAGMVLRLDLLDYMRAIPFIGKYNRFLEPLNREAGYMVLHEDYFTSPHPAPAGCVEQFCFAYSVAPWTVMPTIAAYGPGRFHSAFKQFRFFLLEDGSVSIEVLFIVAPRCHRMLNIFGFDPAFGPPRLLDKLTFGRFELLNRAKAAVNHYAMGHHARVHDNLLVGMRHIWETTNWQPSALQSAANSSSGR